MASGIVTLGRPGGVMPSVTERAQTVTWGRGAIGGGFSVEATRRDVLKFGGLGALGVAGATVLPWGAGVGAKVTSTLPADLMPRPFRTRFQRPPTLRPVRSFRDGDGVWVDAFSVTERRGRAQFTPGVTSTVFGYNGIAPGPTIKTMKGRRSIVRVRNHLPDVHPLFGTDFATSVHLHGSASLPQYDGYASDVTPPGFFKDYHYPNAQNARTLWYHDHGVHHTAHNAYSGLYAQYHIHDRAEMDLLPQGEFDVPLTVGDLLFGSDGNLAYDDRSHSGLMGDVIGVNGKAWPVMRVRRRVYRFRLLVASAARSYRFALSTGDPVTMVATDGGLMPQAVEVGQWRQSSGERYEFLIDFSEYRAGQRIVLRNLSNDNNVDFADTDKVMAFDVTDAPVNKRDATWKRIPAFLVSTHAMEITEAQSKRVRRDVLDRTGGNWTIDGNSWQDVVDSDFQLISADPNPGDIEVMEFENKSGGWFHPAHIHLVDFKVLSRNGRPPFDYELGPKDTVYLGENETVRVLVEYGPHRGRYMVHCHNLAHEDHDMMVQYAVGWKPGDPDPNDPLLAAPCRVDNLPRTP
jgi:FtsP/CotA-like multicopper oxidase with cupredoxin domain